MGIYKSFTMHDGDAVVVKERLLLEGASTWDVRFVSRGIGLTICSTTNEEEAIHL